MNHSKKSALTSVTGRCFLLSTLVTFAVEQAASAGPPTPRARLAETMSFLQGTAVAGLQPEFVFERDPDNWHVNIDYKFVTNTSPQSWLRVTNRVTAKLRAWASNGAELPITNADAEAVLHLPQVTTVSNILRTVYPQSRRGLQWIQTGSKPSVPGDSAYGGSFSLAGVYGCVVTNDVILELTPLAYKVEADGLTARLVDFPALTVELLPNRPKPRLSVPPEAEAQRGKHRKVLICGENDGKRRDRASAVCLVHLIDSSALRLALWNLGRVFKYRRMA
jgi:hypothetical protein